MPTSSPRTRKTNMRITDAILRAEAIKDVLTDIGDGNYEIKGCEGAVVNEEANWCISPEDEAHYDLHWGRRCFRIDEEYLMVLLEHIRS